MKTHLKRMEGVTDAALYEAIIDTWNEIVDENESERHLVSEADWNGWRAGKKSISDRIKEIGSEYERTGQWRGLEQMRDRFLGTRHVPVETLAAEASAAAAAAQAKANQERQARDRTSFISRLRRKIK